MASSTSRRVSLLCLPDVMLSVLVAVAHLLEACCSQTFVCCQTNAQLVLRGIAYWSAQCTLGLDDSGMVKDTLQLMSCR